MTEFFKRHGRSSHYGLDGNTREVTAKVIGFSMRIIGRCDQEGWINSFTWVFNIHRNEKVFTGETRKEEAAMEICELLLWLHSDVPHG